MLGTKYFKKSIAPLGAMLFLVSCSNNPKEVMAITQTDNLPMDVQINLVLSYSDSSLTRLQLKAPVAESYPQVDEPKREFPKGIDVTFFDNFGRESTRLKANHATQYVTQNRWHARGNVVVVNDKGEQLNTEELYWDQRNEKIYSDKKVKITTDNEVIFGEGFEADQTFNNYTIKKVTGQITLQDEEDA